MEWIGRLSPTAINALIASWAFVSIQQHDYARVAGWIVFILFCECDRIKSKLDSQNDRIHALGERVRRFGVYPPLPLRRGPATRHPGHGTDEEAHESQS